MEKTYTFEFNTKESYLAAIAAWKTRYRGLSIDIKKLKVDIKEKQRAGKDSSFEQNSLVSQKEIATDMLEWRKASKIEAGRQYELSKKETQ